MKGLYMFFGLLMIVGLVLGIVFTFVTIWQPNTFNAQMALSGGVGYLIFGYLTGKVK